MQKLSEAPCGPKLRLISVDEPRNPHVSRLCELGFVPGALLRIVKETKVHTPMLVEINGAFMCIERSLAHSFWVREEPN